ncbi:NCAPD3 [Mytilus coruscus]|uniref:NCAPD3 n=1 Tax=Mytilus coruscus TaxID=42192 RepID=A0A6J8DG73_MYTCO|nr:NCAPD3 [Mytilus coruscus]
MASDMILTEKKRIDYKLMNQAEKIMTVEGQSKKRLMLPLSYEVERIVAKKESSRRVCNFRRNGLDKSKAIVETRFRIYNKKRDGSTGNQHKYTVNCYNKTSRILVNGVKTDKFVENVLPIILELITSNELELNLIMTFKDHYNQLNTEIVHNNTSVNNTVNDVLHLDQQEPAIEFPKDKDQSTLPPEDEMKRIQQNIQIVETNSSIVITEETQSNEQNMLITSNSVQAVAQNKTATEPEQRPTVKEKETNNQRSSNRNKGQQRKSKDVEEFKKYIYELENRL